MSEKVDWNEFRYPGKCLLSDRAKEALKKSAGEGRCPPSLQCHHAIGGTCLEETQKECYNRGLDLEKSQKTET